MKSKFVILSQLLLVMLLTLFIFIVYIIGLRVFYSGTVYYIGINSIYLSGAALSITCWIFRNKIKSRLHSSSLELRDFFPCLLTAMCLVYSFHIICTMSIDRAGTVYLLNQLDTMNKDNKGVTLPDLQTRYLAGYVGGYSAVCRRLTEQMKNGDVVRDGQAYSLTPKGKSIIEVFRVIPKITGVDPYFADSNDPKLLPYQYTATENGCKLIAAHVNANQ